MTTPPAGLGGAQGAASAAKKRRAGSGQRGQRAGAAASAASAQGAASAASAQGAGGRRPRVFVVDDHALFRAGVRAELGDNVDVVGEADEVGPAIELITSSLPDVVLLDVHMPGGGGQAVVAPVKAAHPQVRFLALSISDAPEDVIAVIRAGARGYVTKTSRPELVDAVRRVADGDAVFSPRLAGFVLDAFAAQPAGGGAALLRPRTRPADHPGAPSAPPHRPRLHLQGDRRGAQISVKTVERHVSAVLHKLQLPTRYQLTRWATERRLT